MQSIDITSFEFDGVPIAHATPGEAVDLVISRSRNRSGEGGAGGKAYRLINAYSLALASRDRSYKRLLAGPGVNLPDGRPLAAILTRLARDRTCYQVRGPAFFESVLDAGREKEIRHFFLGTTEDTLDKLRRSVEERFPGVTIVGSFSPPFRALTKDDHDVHDRMILESGADIVWVGMGTPRQDFETRRIADSTGVTAVGVGAAFDFSAGTKRQAPGVVRRMGLEWLFRMLSEPRRLTRRYVVGNSVFLKLAMQERRRS
ncbi:hypothetical protein ASG49_09975 [Marmoricola sp. Leaf446]|uniref:WecB/TagA/CpsF family glycosyltransferase n=1 Tax=Marmoricola sp. Leaf446 TaxID=1736379 RepID=UPI0006F2A6A6|nr:WecB/TagA/CpsF family glycosyltransferase [Marmoricola sp. Leaf446]KQT92254.1 hypothetical protein ASG49_09975 [Marmoricola sp. Leaf446]